MKAINRRVFSIQLLAAGATVASGAATAQSKWMSETDPDAVALGYREDTSKVDKAKFPQHKPDQNCLNCSIFKGKTADGGGTCFVFGNRRLLPGTGWCSQWAAGKR